MTRAQLQVGASPRGSLALLKLARCSAALRGRDFVTPEDVKAIAVPALAHRLTLQPELWVQQVSAEDVVRDLLETVPVPRRRRSRPPDDVGEPEADRVRGARRRRHAGGARNRPPRLRRAVGAVRALPRGRRSPRPPVRELRVGFSLGAARTLEGSTVGAQLDVRADGPAEWVELELVLPEGVTSSAMAVGSRSG